MPPRATAAKKIPRGRKGPITQPTAKTKPAISTVRSKARQTAGSRKAGENANVLVGRRVKYARLQKSYTLNELAEIVGCSVSMLSKVENDRLRPSLNMLHRIAQALGTNIGDLLSDLDAASESVLLFRAGQRQRFEADADVGGSGVSFERLLPMTRTGLLQANILTLKPGTESESWVQHAGEDFGFVIEGQFEIVVDGAGYPVKAGDAFFFPSSLSHGYRNNSGQIARVLWVNTPPSL